MNRENLIVRAYIKEKLAEKEITIQEEILDALSRYVYLEDQLPDIENEKRWIKITEDTNNEITAEQISFYRLLKVPLHDLACFAMKEYSILLSGKDSTQIAMGLLVICFIYFPQFFHHSFNEQNAKILLLIFDYKANDKTFNEQIIQKEYQEKYGEELSLKSIMKTLKDFAEVRIIKPQQDGSGYLAVETITYSKQ